MANEIEKLQLHFKYCAAILLLIIIVVATDRWTAQKDFTAYLSNAATMTSLLLGLVAIIYSYISTDSLSKSLGSITTVSSEVKDSKEQIARYVVLTTAATETSTANTALLKQTSIDVSQSVASLGKTLTEIAEQNQALQGLVGTLPVRFEKLESKFTDVAKALGEKPAATQSKAVSGELSSEVVRKFMARSTVVQHSYICLCTCINQK